MFLSDGLKTVIFSLYPGGGGQQCIKCDHFPGFYLLMTHMTTVKRRDKKSTDAINLQMAIAVEEPYRS
jgi:hypothetical protein